MMREALDLLQEVVLRDPLGHVRDEHLLAHLEAAVLLDVAGHALGGAGGDGRAQDERVALAQHRQQVVDHAADLGDVDLDVDVGRRPQREHDVVGLGRVLDDSRALEPALAEHAVEQLLRAGLTERHPTRLELGEDRLLALDSDHVEPVAGEGKRQRQSHPAQTDYGDALCHRGQSTRGDGAVRPDTGGQSRRRSAGSCEVAWQQPPRL